VAQTDGGTNRCFRLLVYDINKILTYYATANPVSIFLTKVYPTKCCRIRLRSTSGDSRPNPERYIEILKLSNTLLVFIVDSTLNVTQKY